jgi:hypothetical protein
VADAIRWHTRLTVWPYRLSKPSPWSPALTSFVAFIREFEVTDSLRFALSCARFHKRPGMWCAWCDFLPVCLKDERKVVETLVRVR